MQTESVQCAGVLLQVNRLTGLCHRLQKPCRTPRFEHLFWSCLTLISVRREVYNITLLLWGCVSFRQAGERSRLTPCIWSGNWLLLISLWQCWQIIENDAKVIDSHTYTHFVSCWTSAFRIKECHTWVFCVCVCVCAHFEIAYKHTISAVGWHKYTVHNAIICMHGIKHCS